MRAYYNEIDPFAAQWLRELIKAGQIAPGDVDERSIEDVKPADLVGYTQCHFFAGIGVWSLALRRAGWPDNRPVWTASCPCQPFSAAGQTAGFADERHLWPALHWLISEQQPAVIFGEQVASKAAEPWVDLVQIDMEKMGYAFGCVAFPSAGVGAPHIRDRAYWVGVSGSERLEGFWRGHQAEKGQWQAAIRSVAEAGKPCRMADANRQRLGKGRESDTEEEQHGLGRNGSNNRPGPTNGFWRNADWLSCRDGKWRPVEPDTFPLANGAAARVGRLRGYGNAINAEAAAEFIKTKIEVLSTLG